MSNTYWMVEKSINGSAYWWMRPPLNHEHWDSPHRWTTDSAKAVHFPKKDAADLIVGSDMCECFATEHMDIGGIETLSKAPPQKPDWNAACDAMRWLNDIEALQGGRNGPSIKLRAAIEAMQRDLAAAQGEPVAQVVAIGQYEFPGLEWMSADHSFRAPIGTKLYAHPDPRIAALEGLLREVIAEVTTGPLECDITNGLFKRIEAALGGK